MMDTVFWIVTPDRIIMGVTILSIPILSYVGGRIAGRKLVHRLGRVIKVRAKQ